MKNRSIVVKIVTWVLVLLMVASLFSGVLALIASAADDPPPQPVVVSGSVKLVKHNTTSGSSQELTTVFTIGKASQTIFDVEFLVNVKGLSYNSAVIPTEFDSWEFYIPVDSSFTWFSDSQIKIEIDNSRLDQWSVRLTNIQYNGGSTMSIPLSIVDALVDAGVAYNADVTIPIPDKYFRTASSSSSGSSGSDDGEDEGPPTSDIVIETVAVKTSNGQKLEKVDKKTPPFTVEIVYYDIGLQNESFSGISETSYYTFITSAAGFKTLSGTSGKLELISTKGDYPKFRATFKNIQTDGSANSLGFRVQYDLKYSKTIKGEGTAVLYQIEKEDEESSDEIAPLKPNVIVQEYSYGDEEIVAGDEFELSLSIQNTSKDVPVEDLVMTVTPASGFTIAAASNTVYFSSLAAGAALPYKAVLRALPSTTDTVGNITTDYSVEVKFAYQYYNPKDKAYSAADSTIKIAVPVAQLDRFTVEEITDYSQYLTMGEEGYVSVPIINKGKSLTYNISGFARREGGSSSGSATPSREGDALPGSGEVPAGDEPDEAVAAGGALRIAPLSFAIAEAVPGGGNAKPGADAPVVPDGADFVAPVTNFGNLEAGKSGTVDLAITIMTPGEFNGEAVIQYEDENMQQKEIVVPFVIMVQEPYLPEMPDPGMTDPGMTEPQGPSMFSILFCVGGALLLAAPVMLYIIKRVKAKGSMDIDEDF